VNKYLLDPSQSHLIEVIDQQLVDGHKYYLATFSPVGAGQFKFWVVTDADNTKSGLQDLFPDAVLEPPSPSSTELWTLAQFRITQGPERGQMSLWVLWKNNTSYKVQTVEFHLTNIPEFWSEWRSVVTETTRDIPLPTAASFEPTDATDKWLDYIFYPGRYSDSTLETSLCIYVQGLGATEGSHSNFSSLRERVCSAVASTVTLNQTSESTMDYERYREDTDAQWRRFYRLAAELDKKRGEAFDVIFDNSSQSCWTVLADGLATIRQTSRLEFLHHNRSILPDAKSIAPAASFDDLSTSLGQQKDAKLAGLVSAASVFRSTFSDRFLYDCSIFLDSEILQDPSASLSARIQNFYDRCNFADQVAEDDWYELEAMLEHNGGYEAIDTALFIDLIDELLKDVIPRKSGRRSLTHLGEALLTQGAQEAIQLSTNVIFDLLVMVVLLQVEVVGGGEIPVDNFNGPYVYVRLLQVLKKYKVLGWMAKTRRTQYLGTGQDDLLSGLSQLGVSSQSKKGRKAVTVLQDLNVHYLKWPEGPGMQVLTNVIDNVLTLIPTPLSGGSLETSYDENVNKVMCNFLRTGNITLASDFTRFQSNSIWATYLKGRLFITRQEYTLAANAFRRSAFGIGMIYCQTI
jgi:nuclear pore complex protein Nup160